MPVFGQLELPEITKEIPEEESVENSTQATEEGSAATTDSRDDAKRTPIPGNTAIQSTILRDVRLATFFELVNWLRRLDLDTSGSRSEIEERIFEHYNIPYIPPATEEEEEASDGEILVVIDTAHSVEYFQLELEEEKYVRLSGGVIIRIDNRKQELQHIIHSDTIIINRSLNILTATGDIKYTLKYDSGDEEKFEGDSITFNFKSWDGVFLGGEVITEDKLNAQSTEDFIFQGNTITRTDDDVVVFEQANLFSARVEQPYYSLRGSKLWLLADQEWAISNAVLYVGNVPTFYIPFFFKNANRLFFRPSIGLHAVKGPYVHTTTYFYGKPEQTEDSFSVLRVTNSSKEEDSVIEGLFLKKKLGSNKERTDQEEIRKDWTLKFLLDGYSRYGVYAAVVGKITGIESFDTLNFRFGLAGSRTIFKKGSVFTNYVIHDGKVQDNWHSSYLFNTKIPIRYELATNMSGSFRSVGSWALDFEWYSDTHFLKDFHERQEQFSWGFILGRLIADNQNQSTALSERSNFSWTFSSSYAPDISQTSPWLKINLKRFNVGIDWAAKQLDTSNYPSVLQGKSLYANPEGQFFYPVFFKAPDISLELSGTLLDYQMSYNDNSDPEEYVFDDVSTENPGTAALIPPWDERPTSEERDNKNSFHLGELQSDGGQISFPSPFSANISYLLTTDLTINNATPHSGWKKPEDMQFDNLSGYNMLENKNSGNINYSLGFLNDQMNIKGSFIFDVNYYDLLEYTLTGADLTNLKKDEALGQGRSVKHNLVSKLYPFKTFPIFQESVIVHTLNSTVYAYVFEEMKNDSPTFKDSVIAWNKKMITDHSIEAVFATSFAPFSQSLRLTSSLPPKDIVLTPSWSLTLGDFTASVSTGIKDIDKPKLIYDPLKVSASYSLDSWMSISQEFLTDIEKGELTSSSTKLSFYFLDKKFSISNTLLAQRSKEVSFQRNKITWEEKEKETFALQSFSFHAGMNYPIGPFWKNRITIRFNNSLGLEYNFLRFTESALKINYGIEVDIYRFLKLSLSVNVRNDQIYRYFPSLADQIGVSSVNFFTDLGYSFNIFSESDLLLSNFKLQSVALALTHDLGDWSLTLNYTGKPGLVDRAEGKKYEWQNSLNVSIQWRPITELKTGIKVDNDGVDLLE